MDSQYSRRNLPAKNKELTKKSKNSNRNKFFYQSIANLLGQLTRQLLYHLSANSSGQSQRGGRGHSPSYWQEISNQQSGQKYKSNNTFVTRFNILAWKDKQTDLDKIICYNCNNKRHYANT